MTALATGLPTKPSTEATTEFQTFISVGLFCAIGLLLSVGVLVLDKYIPGEWF